MKDLLKSTYNKVVVMTICLIGFFIVCFIPIEKSSAAQTLKGYSITCWMPNKDTIKFVSPLFTAMPSNYMLFIKEGKNFATNLPCTIEPIAK